MSNGKIAFRDFFNCALALDREAFCLLYCLLFFIDNIVSGVRSTSAGCYMYCVCCSILLYADDILLIAQSVMGPQTLLDACEKELIDIDMRVNVKK